jgi:hypothetical protein
MALTKVRGSGIDADGQEIILDADTDTTITADTDDQVDIKVGGTDRAVFLANNLHLAGGTVARVQFSSSGVGSAAVSNNSCFVEGNDDTLVFNAAGNGNTIFQENNTERMRIKTGGPIGLGTHGSSSNINDTILLTATGNGSHDDHFWSFGPHFTADTPSFYTINEGGTGVVLSHGNTSWSTHSDERIKENITSLENVLPDLKNVRCVKYNLKGQTGTKIGFIAQDWESKFSEVVQENGEQVIETDGSVGMAANSESTTAVKIMQYTETIPVLLKAIQELEERITKLEAK